jgi:integrase
MGGFHDELIQCKFSATTEVELLTEALQHRDRVMASIQKIASTKKGGKAVYRVQVRTRGESRSATFPNLQEAKEWAASTEASIREGRHFPHLRAQRTTFAELAQRYRDSVLKEVRPSNKPVREGHLAWWEERFTGLTLADITPDVVAEGRDALVAKPYVKGKARTKRGVQILPKEYKRSGATVNRYLATLSHMFTMAVKEWRLVDRNPVLGVSKRKEARGRARFLSDEERDALLTACGKSNWEPLYTLVLLAISTGARKGELINLKWTDVRLDPKAARAVVHETKNGEPRTLPLVGKVLEALRGLKLKDSARSEYVFPQPSGLPGPYENFDAHWYEALESAEIEDFHFHDLRHTTASMLAAQGASLLEIADVLGHKTLAMVKRYSHLVVDHKAKVIEKMIAAKGL